MKRTVWLTALLLCMLLNTGINFSRNNDISTAGESQMLQPEEMVGEHLSGELSQSEQSVIPDHEELPYVQAYKDFLLHTNIDEGDGFPILGYYLLDLNWDQIPELGVLHHSGGSMGGYFTFYYFNENKIEAVLNEENERAQVSNYSQILADIENKKVYLFKEMYLLQGNFNGTYGYIRQVLTQDNILSIHSILALQVDQESNSEKYGEKDYGCEDDYLSDPELDDCIITRYYSESEWFDIPSARYLELKRTLIPAPGHLTDLCDTEAFVLGSLSEVFGDDIQAADKKLTHEEIDILFSKWNNSLLETK